MEQSQIELLELKAELYDLNKASKAMEDNFNSFVQLVADYLNYEGSFQGLLEALKEPR